MKEFEDYGTVDVTVDSICGKQAEYSEVLIIPQAYNVTLLEIRYVKSVIVFI